MTKNLLYTALWLMGIMGTLAIWVVNAETLVSEPYGHVEYTLNQNKEFDAKMITITNWTDTITILDRNLWATAAWTWCEDLDMEGRCEWWDPTYGYHFQWWNNRWFAPCTWGYTWEYGYRICDSFPWWEISKSIWTGEWIEISVPASLVGPWYSSWVFYTFWVNWIDDNSKIDMWWWMIDEDSWDDFTVDGEFNIDNWERKVSNATDRLWPCPEWFHVPTLREFLKLKDMMQNSYDRIHSELYIPLSSYRDEHGSIRILGSLFSLRSSTVFNGDWLYDPQKMAYSLIYPSFEYTYQHSPELTVDSRSRWNSIRCFYNFYYNPQSLRVSFNSDDTEIWSGKASLDSIYTWDIPNIDLSESGYKFDRYLSGTDSEFDFSTQAITWGMIDQTGNVYFIAQINPIEYQITYELNGWVNNLNNVTWYTIEDEITFENPTKDWYSFDGWFTDAQFTTWITNITVWTTWDITLYAKWTEIKKSSWWYSWWWMRKDNCPDGDFSPSYYDWTCWSSKNGAEDDTQDTFPEPQNGEGKSQWLTESENAYNFAFKNWITTLSPIQKANLDWYIKRGHLAKMVVNYVVNVLWKEIPSDIPASCLSFNDETAVRESEEIKDYAIKSCALWLMWISMKNNEFLPNDYVTRAEFGAVLSRVLWWDKYNLVHTKEKPRYTDHLNALKEEWIMTQIDNPKMLEKRWYIMIMLMRSVK